MVGKKKLLQIIIVFILIVLIVIGFYPYIAEMLDLYNPLLGDKYRFVRYYACSLAICTKGCGSTEVGNICVDYDDVKKECYETCQDICDDHPEWGSGQLCGDKYKINLQLEGEVRLNKVRIAEQYANPTTNVYRTEIDDIIYKFHENPDEDFPSSDELIKDGSRSDSCRYFEIIGVPSVYDRPNIIRGLGQFFEEEWPKEPKTGCTYPNKEGGGSIILIEEQAYETFQCFGYDDESGFDECTFVGNLEIWSFENPKKEDCADVIIRDAGEPFTGGFTIDTPKEVTIPKDLTDSFAVMITNKLGEEYGDATFNIRLVSPPEGAGCDLQEESVTIPNGETDGVIVTCTPIEYPPDEYYTIEIKVWDGSIADIEKVELSVGKLTVYVDKESDKESVDIIVGGEQTFDVYLRNELGRDATISLDIDSFPDSNVNCNFDDTSTDKTTVTVDDGDVATTKMRCKPTDAAKGKTYDVIVTAKYDTLTDDDIGVEITIPECDLGVLSLKFMKDGEELSVTNPLYSGDDFTLRATGFEGCDKLKGYFSVYEEGLKIGDCVLNTTDWDVCDLSVTANSPDTYIFYASVDVDGDNAIDASTSNSLTINAGPRSGSGYTGDQGRCVFYVNGNDICEEWHRTWWCPLGCWFNCKQEHCLDSQTCRDKSPSNVCCLDDNDNFCNGPGCDSDSGESDVPCLTTDIRTDENPTQDFWWRRVDNARNVLVSDDREAKFIGYTNCNNNNDRCTGGPGGPVQLSSAWCDGSVCKVVDDWGYYGWEFIRISDESRPVYGVMIKIRACEGGGCGWSMWNIYLHEKNGNWFNITKNYEVYSDNPSTSIEIYKKPENGWSWENIDAMLIGFVGEDDGYVDYIGLLTKDGSTPYCTEGTGDYNRVVDDGKRCYWGVDCETGETDLTGFNFNGVSDGIGPLYEFKCDCSSGTCGEGYCHDAEHGIDYSNVRCAHGGWRGDKV